MITFKREALNLSSPGHPDRSSPLDNLAYAFHIRHEQLGRMEDLEKAITYSREVLGLRPPGHVDRCMSLSNLGSVIVTRYLLLGRIEDLEEAITHYLEALDLCPLNNQNRSAVLNKFAAATVITILSQVGWRNRLRRLHSILKHSVSALIWVPKQPCHRSSY